MAEPADFVRPFRIDGQNVNGRVVKLGQLVTDVLSRHDYPEAINVLLGEALVLAAMLGSTLKFDGRFILQLQGKGPVSVLMADYNSGGALRGFAQFDAEQLVAAQKSGQHGLALLGTGGHMAFTVDQGADMDRYQGIVPLEGDTLAEAALGYFQRSEQIGTRLKLAAAPMMLAGGRSEWRAGGIMVQQAAEEGGEAVALRVDDDWNRLCILLDTTEDSELLDSDVTPETLTYRLFHEDGVRLFEPRPLHFDCPCSVERVRNMLIALPEEDREALREDEKIEVRCEFCSTLYHFSPEEALDA